MKKFGVILVLLGVGLFILFEFSPLAVFSIFATGAKVISLILVLSGIYAAISKYQEISDEIKIKKVIVENKTRDTKSLEIKGFVIDGGKKKGTLVPVTDVLMISGPRGTITHYTVRTSIGVFTLFEDPDPFSYNWIARKETY